MLSYSVIMNESRAPLVYRIYLLTSEVYYKTRFPFPDLEFGTTRWEGQYQWNS